MNSGDKSIILISEDSAFKQRLTSVVKATGGGNVTECDATLAKMNGKACEMAKTSELIIFQAQNDPTRDVEALTAIIQGGGSARLLAVSDRTTSFGAAHRLMQAGVSEVVPDSLADSEIGRIVTRLSMPRRLTLANPEKRDGKVIAVAKARGGIGATTLAVNLADALCARKSRFGRTVAPKHKVVLVDMDLQFGAVAGFLDLPPNDAFYRLARDRHDPDSVFLDQSVTTLANGLDVLAAPEGFMPLTALTPEQIRDLVQRLQQKYDYVVIDLPQVMVEWLTPVIEASTRVFVLTGSSVPFVQQTRRLIDFFREQNPGVEIEVLIGKEKKPLLASRRQAEAEWALEQKFRNWLPPDDRVAADAMDRGRPLSISAPRSALAKAIARIAHGIFADRDKAAANAVKTARRQGD
jgi:pilus assembly protein CpaE